MSTDAVEDSSPDSAEASEPRRSLLWVTLSVAAAIYILDQLSKWYVVSNYEGKPRMELVGSLLQLNVVRNPGAAFSLGAGFTIIFSLIALAVVGVIIKTASTLESKLWAVALGGLLGGALGNLTDRMLREPGPLRGHVVDFLQLPHWPIFNVADMAVVGGAILMVALTLFGVPFSGKRAVKAA